MENAMLSFYKRVLAWAVRQMESHAKYNTERNATTEAYIEVLERQIDSAESRIIERIAENRKIDRITQLVKMGLDQ